MKKFSFLFLFLLVVNLVMLPNFNVPAVQAQKTNVFGNPTLPNWLNITVVEDPDFIIVDNADGFVFKFRKATAGYNEIWQNGSLIIEDERWRLEYEFKTDNWRMRGEPQSVSWEQLEPYHVIVKRFYTDFAGTTFNITYSFYGGFRPKIGFNGTIGQSDTYRLVWKATGINKTYVQDEPSNRHVKFWNENETAIVFDYSDVYESFDNITTIEVEEWAGNHKLDEVFNVGFLDVGWFRLDPNFGYEGAGASKASTGGVIRGSVFTITEDGTGDNITAYLNIEGNGVKSKCAIYKHSDLSLVADGVTDEKTGVSGIAWYTYNFPTAPTLTAGTAYILVVWSDIGPPFGFDTAELYYTVGDADQGHKDVAGYDGFPNPFVNDQHSTNKYSIYGTYTVAGGAEYSRTASQALSVALTTARIADFSRATTQTINIALSTARIPNFIRGVTQAIGVALSATRTFEITRTATQAISIGLAIGRTADFVRASTQAIGITLESAKSFEITRTVTQAISVALSTLQQIFTIGTPGGAGPAPGTTLPTPPMPTAIGFMLSWAPDTILYYPFVDQNYAMNFTVTNNATVDQAVTVSYWLNNSSNETVWWNTYSFLIEASSEAGLILTYPIERDGEYTAYAQVIAPTPAGKIQEAQFTATSGLSLLVVFFIIIVGTILALAIIKVETSKKKGEVSV